MVHALSGCGYFGGLVGISVTANGSTLVQSTLVTYIIQSTTPINAEAGGLVAYTNDAFGMYSCGVLIHANGIVSGIIIGGVVENTIRDILFISFCQVNVTVVSSAVDASISPTYVGGLVGYTTALTNPIMHAAIYFQLTVSSARIIVGGIVAFGNTLRLQDCMVICAMVLQSHKSGQVIVRDIVGQTENSVLAWCLFIGDNTTTMSHKSTIGCLGGAIDASIVRFCYALTNIRSATNNVAVGTIEAVSNSIVTICYSVLNVSVNATGSLTIGSFAGEFTSESAANNSFTLSNITAAVQNQNGIVGGFVGVMNSSLSTVNITNCYAWGSVAVTMGETASALIGGLAGYLLNSVSVSKCILYVNFSAVGDSVISGSFAGRVEATNLTSGVPKGKIEYTAVYAAPSGGITNVSFISKESATTTSNTHCAADPNTAGCVALGTLNSRDFLKAFNFDGVFQLDAFVANGGLAFRTLPVPPSRATIARLVLVLPSAARSPE